jgi:hypothetical protein
MVSEPCVGWLTISWKDLQEHRLLLNLLATVARFVRFEILIMVLLRIQIFWDVMLWPSASGPWHFEGFWCVCLPVSSSPRRIASWTAWHWRWRHYKFLYPMICVPIKDQWTQINEMTQLFETVGTTHPMTQHHISKYLNPQLLTDLPT